MAEDKEKSTTPLPWSTTITHSPMEHSGEANLVGAGAVGVDTRQYNTDEYGTLDVTPPPPAQQWLEKAARRMMDAPDPPRTITEAARRLEVEMRNAHVRRQVDEKWTCGTIINNLRPMGLFEIANRGQPGRI